MTDKPDALLAQARSDAGALGLLYEAHYERIYRYCAHRLLSPELAEDLTSEVFMKMAAEIRSCRGTTRAAFAAWLYRIACNCINAHMRKAKRRRAMLDILVQHAATHSDPRASEEPDWPTVHRAICSLKPNHQAVVTLRFFEGMSPEQIAGVLNCRAGTVRVWLSRALKHLKHQLAYTEANLTR